LSEGVGKDTVMDLARGNNFDFLRLYASLQVFVHHAIAHLNVTEFKPLCAVLGYLPGVPIFFVISGFLISKSWERAPSLRQYVRNRFLRIYPALWVCLAISIIIFWSCGIRPWSASDFFSWILSQATFFQFYNPDFLRYFGVGVINGSLWTIPVELQFYILLPVIALVAKRTQSVWVICLILSGLIMLGARYYMSDRELLFQKLLGVSLLPYLFYFIVGVVGRQLYEKFPFLFEGKFFVWAVVYVAWVTVEISYGIGGATGNHLNIISIFLIGMLTIGGVFSGRGLSSRILKQNDLSYGIYIYHMPIVNLLLFYELDGLKGFAISLVSSLVISILSWHLVESRALNLKKYSLRKRFGLST